MNSRDVFIIKVKYKAHSRDLQTLIRKKTVHFKTLFPHYQDHHLHLGLASFYMDNETKQSALDQHGWQNPIGCRYR